MIEELGYGGSPDLRWLRRRFVPEGQPIIAQRFSVGLGVEAS